MADGPNAFESVNGSGSADDEGIKRGVNLGLVAGVQRTCDRFSDIAAYERFAEHLHHPGGLRSFAQLRATVAARLRRVMSITAPTNSRSPDSSAKARATTRRCFRRALQM